MHVDQVAISHYSKGIEQPWREVSYCAYFPARTIPHLIMDQYSGSR